MIPAPKDVTGVLDKTPLLPHRQEPEAEAHRNVSADSNRRVSRDTAEPQQDSDHHQEHYHDGGESPERDNPLVETRDDDCMPSEPSPPSAPGCPTPPELQPKKRVRGALHVRVTGDDGVDASAAGISSASAADTSSSSGSSVTSNDDQSWYDDDSDEAAAGILEDFTEGVDAWLEDVHGAGREAFFGLFKRDATPQFCRPSLEVLGRNVSAVYEAGIGPPGRAVLGCFFSLKCVWNRKGSKKKGAFPLARQFFVLPSRGTNTPSLSLRYTPDFCTLNEIQQMPPTPLLAVGGE